MPRTRHPQSEACHGHTRTPPAARLSLALAALGLVSLSGCVAGELAQYRSDLREMRATAERLCQERGGVEIYQPIPEMMDVLTMFTNAGQYRVVSEGSDPLSGGKANYQMIEQVNAGEMAQHTASYSTSSYTFALHYLSTDRVRAVDLLIENFQGHRNSYGDHLLHDGDFLPDRTSPNGMYRYVLADAGNPACKPFNEMMDAFEAQGRQPLSKRENDFHTAVVRRGECILITYLGPKETYKPAGYIYHSYRDDDPALRVWQTVDELISPEGVVIARLRNFTPGTRYNNCGGETDILEHFVYQ